MLTKFVVGSDRVAEGGALGTLVLFADGFHFQFEECEELVYALRDLHERKDGS